MVNVFYSGVTVVVNVVDRPRHSLCGVPRGADQASSLSFLGNHLLPHAADSWPGYHGNNCSLPVCDVCLYHLIQIKDEKQRLSPK